MSVHQCHDAIACCRVGGLQPEDEITRTISNNLAADDHAKLGVQSVTPAASAGSRPSLRMSVASSQDSMELAPIRLTLENPPDCGHSSPTLAPLLHVASATVGPSWAGALSTRLAMPDQALLSPIATTRADQQALPSIPHSTRDQPRCSTSRDGPIDTDSVVVPVTIPTSDAMILLDAAQCRSGETDVGRDTNTSHSEDDEDPVLASGSDSSPAPKKKVFPCDIAKCTLTYRRRHHLKQHQLRVHVRRGDCSVADVHAKRCVPICAPLIQDMNAPVVTCIMV